MAPARFDRRAFYSLEWIGILSGHSSHPSIIPISTYRNDHDGVWIVIDDAVSSEAHDDD